MESAPAAPMAVLRLGVHEVVEAMHCEHGLRSVGDAGDVEAYRAYRRYCVRRIRRSRKALKLGCSKGKTFAKQDVTLDLGDALTAAHLELAVSLVSRRRAAQKGRGRAALGVEGASASSSALCFLGGAQLGVQRGAPPVVAAEFEEGRVRGRGRR
jgi:hypothetical protein